jgi:hypothetical protein
MKRLQSVGAVLGALIASGGAAAARADTIIPGGSIINQTWTTSGSPYVIQGDITVPAGAFLTIQPGVTVQVATFDVLASGFDTSRVEINVKGTLTIAGTDASPVTIQAQTGIVAGSWWGMYVDPTATSASVTGVVIRHAINGIVSNAPASVLQVTGATVNTCQSSGIAVNAGSPTLSRLTMSGCSVGVSVGGAATATIQNSTMFLNSTAGIQVDSATGTTSIIGCTVDTNASFGVRTTGNGAVGIYSTIVSRGAGYGVYRGGTGPVTVSYCDVWQNAAANFFGAAAGVGTISADPFLTAVGDAHLLAGSVCIDAGDVSHCVSSDLFGANRPFDGDGIGGARCDIGAHEFAGCTSTAISAGPMPATTSVGHPFSMSVTATGSGLTYQWRRNMANLISARGMTGTTGPVLAVDMAGLYDAGSYDCVVTGSCGTQTSAPALLTVNPICAADFSGNGVLAVQDIFEFLNAWFAGCP